MTPADSDWPPAASRLGAVAQLLTRAATNRAVLAGLELSETRSQVLGSAVLVAVMAVAALLAGIALTLLVAAIYWDTPQRVQALAWLAGIEVALVLAAALWLRRRWRHWHFLKDTRETLQSDLRSLRQLLGGLSR